jgi:predicted HicB family RNase H-like nuclease
MLRAKINRREREDKNLALKEIGKEEITRFNAKIPVSLHQRLKIVAARRRKSVTELFIEMANEYLSKNSNE